ncbi:hypothetical protein PLICRDRAFT_99893 [Plicaturopsis crispa FD-325 SS-3]|nr:hypothetical protein PLICRDRAFT_99893 [Plicaturopsis crispa FD-325 SS-3]
MGYIPRDALANLKKYSYKGVDKSLLSKHVLTPFWNWFVTLWPLNIAPNTITLLGLSIVFVNFLTLLYYDPAYLTSKDGASKDEPPNWIYFTWGAGLFLYQSFDAIDGKQARRTGMAGPLGEMFDHGCDAINTTLEVILAARALNLGRSWWTVISQIASLANFYLTTWEEYHTGQLYLAEFSGPVEGIIIVCVIYTISGLYGPAFWDNSIWTVTGLDQVVPDILAYVPDAKLNEAFMLFGAVGLGYNIISSYLNVHKAHKSALRPLLRLIPFPFSAALQVVWLYCAGSTLVHSSLLVPFLCAWGLQFAHQVGRMILAHVTKTAFPLWDWMWLWSIIGALDAALPALLGRPSIIQATAGGAAVYVWLTLALSLAAYIRFCTLVIGDITEYMGIACFTVRKKDGGGVWRDAGEIKKE